MKYLQFSIFHFSKWLTYGGGNQYIFSIKKLFYIQIADLRNNYIVSDNFIIDLHLFGHRINPHPYWYWGKHYVKPLYQC